MPNKPISKERLTEPMNFVGTPTMHRRMDTIAQQRGVSFATACRWAIDYWLANGAPTPSTPEPDPIEESSS